MKKVIPWLLTAFLLAVAVFTIASRESTPQNRSIDASGTAAAQPAAPAAAGKTLTVHFYTPTGEQTATVEAGAQLTLEDPAPIEGYTFLGWRDLQGNIEKRAAVPIYEEGYYSAVFTVALNTASHPAYLFPDENGLYRPHETMSRGDFAVILHALLAVEIYGDSQFIDVAPDAPYAEACAALRQLNLVSGSRFYPDEPITRLELLRILTALVPQSGESFLFSDIDKSYADYAVFCTAAAQGWIAHGEDTAAEPDALMTRLDVATILNRATGRVAAQNAELSEIGAVLDLRPEEEGYWDLIEAAVEHSYTLSDGEEHWTQSSPIATAEPGYFMRGYDLYRVDDEGHLYRNIEIDHHYFDDSGRYTSGDEELDALVKQTLEKRFEGEELDDEGKLKNLFNHMIYNFKYRKGPIRDYQDTSWLVEESIKILSTGYGNCYSFAGAYCELARAIGYDAVVYSGYIAKQKSPHAWVEMDIDGVTYVFDPEMTMAYMRDFDRYVNLYKRTYEDVAGWYYIR